MRHAVEQRVGLRLRSHSLRCTYRLGAEGGACGEEDEGKRAGGAVGNHFRAAFFGEGERTGREREHLRVAQEEGEGDALPSINVNTVVNGVRRSTLLVNRQCLLLHFV